ncbi:hypothetical protein [Lysobacter gummosus]|uniref:hypothetical protein n=1 Tax=Lysobacter gummosus TaxID=262324 RepID=UPI003628C83C
MRCPRWRELRNPQEIPHSFIGVASPAGGAGDRPYPQIRAAACRAGTCVQKHTISAAADRLRRVVRKLGDAGADSGATLRAGRYGGFPSGHRNA